MIRKQKELIELRKSIRKRERSQERHSQRSRSKDKKTKGVRSEKGTDFGQGHFVQKNVSHQQLNTKNSKKLGFV